MNNPEVSSFVLPRTIVLLGMMGVGKSSVGRKLASRLAAPFFDSDAEIESAAGMSITEFFEMYGEFEFRKGERRVIARLIEGEPHVLSIGGGAFMDTYTRELIKQRGISIWLKADPEILLERALRRTTGPFSRGGIHGRNCSIFSSNANPYIVKPILPSRVTIVRLTKRLNMY